MFGFEKLEETRTKVSDAADELVKLTKTAGSAIRNVENEVTDKSNKFLKIEIIKTSLLGIIAVTTTCIFITMMRH